MFKLALRNITRHKVRTAMTLFAVAAGVASLILSGGFVQDIFLQLREFTIHSQTGHVQIYKRGYWEFGSQAPLDYIIEDTAGLQKAIRARPEVKDVLARLRFSGLINNGRADHAIVGEGVQPAKEAQLGTHIEIIAGRQLRPEDQFGIVVGEGVAEAQQIQPGDRVTLLLNTKEGALNSLDFELVGVFRTFSKEFDSRAVRVALPAAQELLSSRGANTLVLALDRSESTPDVTRALGVSLGEGIEVRPWNELNDFYTKTVDLYDRQFGVLRLIILGMVLLGVANSVNMSVTERIGEFGTMQALGNRGRDVFTLVMVENLVLGVIGSVLGLLLGIAVALGISEIGISMPPPPNSNTGYVARIQIVPWIVFTSFLVGLVASCGAAVLPARRVSRTPIAEALRYNI
jgi:putative ABC transport system permease protein